MFDARISGILSFMDRNAFESAKLKVLLKQNDPHGFGTLQEKTVHAVMKLYYEPDEDYHEVPVEGYIADIYRDGHIIEIQNGNFGKLRPKLAAFLPLYPVTVVFWSRNKKRGSSRYDRMPISLFDEVRVDRREDFMQFVPVDIEEPFTVTEFAKAAGIRRDLAADAVPLLMYLDILRRIGKRGREYLYEVEE